MSRPAHIGGAMSPISISFAIIFFSAFTTAERWSRQLTGEGNTGEWIPLQSDGRSQQAQARVLVEPQFQNTFFPQETFQDYLAQGGARQLFIQSPNAVPQQNFINRSPAQPIRLTLTGQFNPLPQSFSFPRTNPMPYNEFRQSIQAQFQQPHLVVPPVQLNNQFYNQASPQKGVVLAPQNVPAPQPTPNQEVQQPAVQSSQSTERSESSKPNLPTLKEEIKKEYSEAPIVNQEKVPVNPTTPASTTVEKEEVQLLYVPLETLQNKRFDVKQFLKNPMKQFSLRDSIGSPGQINNQLYPQTTPAYIRQQTQLNNIRYDLLQQQMNAQFLQGAFPRDPKFNHPSSVTPSPFSQATRPIPMLSTPKTKKLKAHQPPLAVYMIQSGKEKARLSDVLTVLKESNSVSVLDNIPPNAPKIFIGPNNLKTPSNIVKFELPYLSNIDGTRSARKIENLPFFVAPLSYKAPNGFAKIPFPAPHVGSVIVNPYMKDTEESSTTLNFENHSSFSAFPQSTTEAFRNTIRDSVPTKPTNFNYFPSSTISQSSPTSFPGSIKSSAVPFPTIPEQYNSVYSTRNPESNIISSSRAPASTFFPTSARPTVSFFGFSEPTFNSHPSTTHKPSTPSLYDSRGHYITNAAVDTPRPPPKQNTHFKESISERPNTSPHPSSHISNGPFNYITPFVLRNPYEPKDFGPNVRGNDIRHFNVVERPVVHNQFAQPQPKYPQFQTIPQRPEVQKVNFPQENTFSSPSYLTEPSPTAGPSIKTTLTPVPAVSQHDQFNNYNDNNQFNGIRHQEQDQFNAYGNKEIISGFVPSFNQYTNPEAESEIPQVTQNEYFETETPEYEPTTTPSTTTTTSTTTTSAPTTRSYTRRPISRGRPRYTTTPKPDGDDTTIRSTTRRTPLRERRPSTYRSRTTTTTQSSVESETTTKPRDYGRLSTRFSSRQKTEEDENATTESTADKTTRNPRFRSRGRVHFKTSDNYEGSDFVSKKKTEKGQKDDLAYQRDVLHQNYPVTLSEKLSTLEVRTTTATPSSTPDNNYNIRIYETTGSTSKPFSTSSYDTQTSEQPYYENEAVFQQEPEKFLTHPDEYIEINGRHGGRTTPSHQHTTAGRTDSFVSSTTSKYEEQYPQTVSEEYFESKLTGDSYNALKNDKHEEEDKIETHGDGGLTYKYAPDVVLTESPVPKFRTKLKNRPKLLQSLNIPKHKEEDNQNLSSDAFVTSTKKIEETTTEAHVFTRKSTPSSITRRPSFSNHRTTMKIEEIEEELKARRTQLRHSSRSSTNKYPIYIPEGSTTAAPAVDENDITTTKRTKIIRRRPIRVTTPSSNNDSPTTIATTEKPVNTKVRRVRVRTKVRKTTTEKAETQPENEDNEAVTEERHTTAAPRFSAQKYSTKNRQRYYKRPLNLAGKNDQSSENVDDQASFDSINRPEIIKYIPETGSHEYVEYNVENGRAESQWSPKTNPNAFRPVFNPNLIADGHKNDDYAYGSKLSLSEINLAEPEIITAGYEHEGDILITVTPPTNNVQSQTTDRGTRKHKEYIAETPSTFETVLEEVMRTLEEQDESEYMTVVKHEGGEIGEIPPESTVKPEPEKDTTETAQETQSTTASLPTTMAEKRFFSTAPNAQVSSTERQARRRGVWRKVNVRPVHKDVLEGAESQFYKNGKNELVNEKKIQNKYEKIELNKVNNNFEIKLVPQEVTTIKDIVPQTTQETVPVSEKNEAPTVEQQTEYPDLIAMEVSEDDVTYSPKKEKDSQRLTEIEINTEYLMSRTDQPVLQENIEKEEVTTTEQATVEESVKEIKQNQEEKVIEKVEEEATTTVQEVKEEKENKIDKVEKKEEIAKVEQTEEPVKVEKTEELVKEDKNESKPEEKPSKSFLEVMDEILGATEEEQITKTVESEKKVENKESEQVVENKDALETSTAGFKFFDPRAIISTSISTEISHETEICYRGKCVKTKKADSKK